MCIENEMTTETIGLVSPFNILLRINMLSNLKYKNISSSYTDHRVKYICNSRDVTDTKYGWKLISISPQAI